MASKMSPLTALVVLSLATACWGSSFHYLNFRDRSYVTLVGNAQRIGENIQLTASRPDQVGAMWFQQQVDLTNGFVSVFDVSVTDPQEGGGEGFAFVIQNDKSNAMGAGGSGLGYSGIRNGLAIEFDMRSNEDKKDPIGFHVAIHPAIRGVMSAEEKPQSDNMWLAVPHLVGVGRVTVMISFQQKILKIFIGRMYAPLITVDMSNEPIDGRYYVGFTASTSKSGDSNGVATVTHTFHNWYFKEGNGKECEQGFIGSTCILDQTAALDECTGVSSCTACMEHPRYCGWCKATSKCQAGFHGAATCFGVHLVSKTEECESDSGSLASNLWSVFLGLVILCLFVGLGGRLHLAPNMPTGAPPQPASGPRLQQPSVPLPSDYKAASYMFAASSGILFGLTVAFVVSCSLVEISISPLFAFSYGVLFVALGALIIWQTFSYHFGNRSGQFTGSWVNCILLFLFGSLIIASGIMCFLLEKNWAKSLSISAKYPVYACLGVSLCFSCVFSFVDLFSRIPQFCMLWYTTPLVKSAHHVRALGAIALIAGLYYGCIFAFIQVEDANKGRVDFALQMESYYCYPVSCLAGGIIGLVYDFFRQKQEAAGEEVVASEDSFDKYYESSDGL